MASFVVRLVTALAACALLGAAPAYTVGPDSFRDPSWGRFFPSLDKFLGARRGGYIGRPEELVRLQVREALSGPPDQSLLLEDGARILSGCRLHSCDEKAAVVLSRANEVQAVGLVSSQCRFVGSPSERRKPPRKRKVECDTHSTLTLFVRPSGRYRAALEYWAEKVVGRALPVEVVSVD
jgi:hypothetical protein